MATATVRSRIKEHFKEELLDEIKKIIDSGKFPNNNQKAKAILVLLDNYEVDYSNLGTGTNRLAILIDGYVFKVALDRWGELDNLNEYTMSKELQPFVTKVYETNTILSVHEYVTLISSEEFLEKKIEIQKILALISESYLLGDVGTVKKNFCNWGYRDDGQLVILDFAYIYRVSGDILVCPKCGKMINYDSNFYNLECSNISCRKKFTYMDIKRRISVEDEMKEIEVAKKYSFIAKKSFDYIILQEDDSDTPSSNKYNREEKKMDKYEVDKFLNTIDEEMEEQEREEMFDYVLDNIDDIMSGKNVITEEVSRQGEEQFIQERKVYEENFDNETDEIDDILNMLKDGDLVDDDGYDGDLYENPEEVLDRVERLIKSTVGEKQVDEEPAVEDIVLEKLQVAETQSVTVEECKTRVVSSNKSGETVDETEHSIKVITKPVENNDEFEESAPMFQFETDESEVPDEEEVMDIIISEVKEESNSKEEDLTPEMLQMLVDHYNEPNVNSETETDTITTGEGVKMTLFTAITGVTLEESTTDNDTDSPVSEEAEDDVSQDEADALRDELGIDFETEYEEE